jgi:TonB family protein
MPALRKSLAKTLAASLFICACILSCLVEVGTHAQENPVAASTSDKERGFELYRKGDLSGAIKALSAAVKKDKKDADAWHLLGIIYYGNGEGKNARKAFETEIRLRPDTAAAHSGMAYALLLENKLSGAGLEAERALGIDAKNADAHYILGVKHFRESADEKALDEAQQTIKLKPKFGPAYLLKIQILLGTDEWAIVYYKGETEEARTSRFKEAHDTLETFLKLYPLAPARELMLETLSSLNGFLMPKDSQSGNAPQAEPAAYAPHNVTEKARILSRTEPEYTPWARRMGISGTVILRGILGADGKVKNIRVVESLPYGLTEVSIRAARGIKFRPAIKDGRPVSQYVQIEYNFFTS